MTMVTDGIKADSKEESVKNLDVVELLSRSCLGSDAQSGQLPT
jgi:hypothetical protein